MRTIILTFWTLIFTATNLFSAEFQHPAPTRWFQVQSRNFTIYSNGRLEDVRRFALKIEQFRQTYATLAGAKAVASVPVVVYAFGDDRTFTPFKPLYQGKPKSVGGFFHRDYDENIIVWNLEAVDARSMELVFHEYTHLLMRHNSRFWPLWLSEGMAELYSTFTMDNNRARLGAAVSRHVDFLRSQNALVPVEQLFRVNHDSPEYNEEEQTGTFYAQSWLLTHYLMLGDSPTRRAQFSVFAKRLREEDASPESIFKEVFKVEFSAMDEELKRYLARARFEPVALNLPNAMPTDTSLVQRWIPEVETYYQLGNIFLHLRRFNEAGAYFRRAQQIAPDSARPYEGLGLSASRQKNFSEALSYFDQALAKRSVNYRVHYEMARAHFGLAAPAGRTSVVLPDETKDKMRTALQKSVQLMPGFASAHYMLGLLEMTDRTMLDVAEKHLKTAIQLEAENQGFQLAMADLQLRRRDPDAAEKTLTQIMQSGANAEIRKQAESLLKAAGELRKQKSGS